MSRDGNLASSYVYTFVCHEEERGLCRMEQRALFGMEPPPYGSVLESKAALDPGRSPFMKRRIAVRYEAEHLGELARLAEQIQLDGRTFKVLFVGGEGERDGNGAAGEITYDEQRAIEREIGQHIRGKAEMKQPERLFGVARAGGRWVLGDCAESEPVWLRHMEKPRNYSTALGTRMARAVANIAVPDPQGIRAIDPCCGIGTVLLEACSMGIAIVGCDINPLAVRGARANLAHFGYSADVSVADMREASGTYDVAILDLPYNLCSVLSAEDQLAMLQSARRLAGRAVVIATETIDSVLALAGFEIADRCLARKGGFARQILLCKAAHE